MPVPPRRGRALPPILVISLILLILEATQGRQCFFEISSMPYGRRVGTNKIRTDPPIATVYVEFFFCSNVGVILVRQFVHVTNHFFSATHFDHGLAQLFVSYESVVDTEEISLLAFLLTVRSTFPHVVVGNRKEVKNLLDVLLVLFRIISQEVTARTADNADVQHRVVHIVQCFQLL